MALCFTRTSQRLGILLVGLTLGASGGGAAAAESLFLPRGKAPAARDVSACEGLGTGFHKVEGSDTCIRIGGSVRVETTVVTGGSARH